jgi:cyclic beta-1,2-glucan synthetase
LRISVRQAFRRWARQHSPWDSVAPIREELFSIERLEQHARSLAVAQTVTPTPLRGHKLANRLADNGGILLDAYRSMATAIEDGRPITPAAEWLIDNYHLIEKQIHEIRSDLPPGYYRQLPKLATGPFAGYPRVFGVAWAFVAHTDSRFDSDMLLRYLLAYQQVQPLTIGELWAVSVTLRIVLIENLRRLAQRIMESRVDREAADALADRLLGAAGRTEEPVAAVLADFEHRSLSEEFAVQFVYRLRDQDARITPALVWLDQRLAVQQTSADEVVRDVHRAQGASNVGVRNVITSLRLISAVDWNEAFERASLVDGVLGDGSAFKAMDFPTRNLYRSAIEELARGSGRSELDIAHTAVRSANEAASATSSPIDGRQSDPGYHLIAGGRWAFEDLIGFRRPWSTWPVDQSRHRVRLQRHDAAGPGASARRPGFAAHPRRGADTVDHPRRHRGTDRTSGDSPPRQSRRRSAFRPAVRLDRQSLAARGSRRCAAGSGGSGHRAAQRALCAGPGWGSLPAVAPETGLE